MDPAFWNRIVWPALLLMAMMLSSLSGVAKVREPVECQLKSGEWAYCLWLDVPENRRVSGGRTIRLHTVLFKAQAPARDKPPIYLLAGGPGQAASEGFLPLPEAFRRLRRHHDIVLVDQRGTGESHPLRCVQDKDSKWDLTFNESLALEHSKRCFDRLRLDTDLTAYTTDASADDIESVRKALGHQKIILFGVSYGTRLALRYVALYPASVHKQILEGVLPPEVNIARERQAFVESLQAVASHCHKDPDCHRFGDPWKHYQKLERAWAQRPKAQVADPRSGEIKTVILRAELLESFVRSLLYVPTDMSIIPQILSQAAAGNLGPLMAKAFSVDYGLYDGLHILLLCAEDFRDMGTPMTDSQKALAATCQLLPASTLPADFRRQPKNSVPTLLLSGGLDPVTPPRYIENLKQVLPRSSHLVLPDYGHNISYVSCIQDAVIHFVESNQAALDPPDCLGRLKALHFFKGGAAL